MLFAVLCAVCMPLKSCGIMTRLPDSQCKSLSSNMSAFVLPYRPVHWHRRYKCLWNIENTGTNRKLSLTRKPSYNAKVSARQQCVYEGLYSEEIYGKSTLGTLCWKYTQWVTRCRWQYGSIFIRSALAAVLPPKSAEFSENSDSQ